MCFFFVFFKVHVHEAAQRDARNSSNNWVFSLFLNRTVKEMRLKKKEVFWPCQTTATTLFFGEKVRRMKIEMQVIKDFCFRKARGR